MYKILVIMRNHTNGICSEVIEFTSPVEADRIFDMLREKSSLSSSTIREVIKLY